MKRFFISLGLALLLAVVLSLGLCASAEVYSGDCGANVSWSLDTETGVLNISGTGAMKNYSYSSSAPWYSYRSFIKTASIEDGVTSIGSYAFSHCESLTSITIPDSVTSIGSYAFSDCANLTSINIPNSVTSIGSSAFYDCISLTSVTLGNSVTGIGSSAFYNCKSLTNVYITDISAWCNIDFNFSSSNPLYHGADLYIDEVLAKDIIISNDIAEIKSYAFYNCESLTSITIPDSVTSIGSYAFSDCANLTSINIPDSVTSVGDYAFYNCKSLTSVTLGNSVTGIGSSAFYDCKSLTSVTLGNSVTSIGSSAFFGCTSLTSIHITDLSAWCNIEFGNNYSNPLCYARNLYIDELLATEITIPSDVTEIKEYAFYNCTSLTSITIPNSVTSIESYAFSNCTSLTSITIPNSVTSIGNSAFSGCTNLTSIEIPDSVTSIGNSAFEYCTNLTSIEIPNSVTSIGNIAFRYCRSLTSITVAQDNEYYSNDERGALFNKDKTTLIQYPIGNTATSYDIPDGVTSIGSFAFYNCTSLTSITIPNSVTSIGDSAFSNCTRLTSITIPNSVTSIGDSAFSNCTRLKDVYYDGVQSQFVKIEIGLNNSSFNSATVHYSGVSVTGVTLNQTEITLMEGEALQLIPTISPDNASDKSVSWSSSNSTVATVIDGVVTAVSAGNANITVTTADGGFSAVCQVTVKAPPTILVRDTVLVLDDSGSMSGTPLTALKTAAKNFCKSVLESNGTNRISVVVFASSVSYTGFTDDYDTLASKIDTMIGSGGTATDAGLNQAKTLLDASTADVKSVVLMTDGEPNSASTTRTAANSLTQSANLYTLGFFHNLTGTYKDNAAALLDEIQNAGYSEVIDPDDLDLVLSDIATNITRIPVESITLDKEELILVAGQSTSLNYSLKPHDATNQTVYWTSLNPAIATVSTNGTVTAIAEGKVTISAQTADGNFTAQCTLYVNSIDAWYYTYTLNNENQATITGYRDGLGSEIVIPAYIENYPVVSIGSSAFRNSKFTSIVIPDSVTSIGYFAFYDCRNLTSINIPDSVTSIGYSAFKDCTSLTSIMVAQDNEYYSSDERGTLFNKYKTTLIQYPVGNTAISYDIPNSVTSIGEYAFAYCKSLTSITIPNSVTSIGYEAFRSCTNLTSINIPDGVTSIGDSSFYYCTCLTSITVAQDNEYYSSDERGTLFNKDKTTLIQYPIGNTATSYDIPNSVTSIDNYAFSDCTSLTSINIPGGVTSMGYSAFSNCKSLTSVTIGNSATSIGVSAFSNCKSLTSITISNSVTSIGVSAFSGCTDLTIYGYANSYAQTYAGENDIPFVVLGDTDNNGSTEYADATTIAKYLSGSSSTVPQSGDMNGDGVITLLDLRELLHYLMKTE